MSLNGLEKITDKILADATLRAEKILSDADAECARIREEYEDRASHIRETMVSDAERNGMEHVARAKADAANRKRNLLLEAQSNLIDSVFESAYEETKNLSEEKYIDLLAGLLTAAMLEQIETEERSESLATDEEIEPVESYEVLMNVRDRDRFGNRVTEEAKKRLSSKIKAEKLAVLRMSDRPVNIDGGLILRAGAVESNCSLSLLFALLREELEAEVSRALFEARGQA